jgi:integrase
MKNIENEIIILQSSLVDGSMSIEAYLQKGHDMMKLKADVLAVHRYKITPPKDEKSRYMTYVGEGKGKSKLVAPTEKKLLEKLANYYGVQARTLTNLYSEWEENRLSRNISQRSVVCNRQQWNRFYEGSAIANKPVKDISVDDVETHLNNQLTMHRLDKIGFNTMKCLLSDMMDFTVKRGYILSNPVNLAKFNKSSFYPSKPKNVASRIFLDDEVAMLHETIDRELLRSPNNTNFYLIKLLFFTGLRVGEAVALKWVDIDRKADELQVRRMESVEKVGDDVVVTVVEHTKKRSGSGFRELPISSTMYGIFDEIRAVNERCGYPDGGFIFANAKGRSKEWSVIEQLARLCKKSGIPSKSTHDIRRTFATKLYKKGIPLATIQRLLGHSDVTTTMGYIVDIDDRQETNKAVLDALAM